MGRPVQAAATPRPAHRVRARTQPGLRRRRGSRRRRRLPQPAPVRDHVPRPARRPRALPRPRAQRRDRRPQRRRASHPGGDQRRRLHRPDRRGRPARRPAVRGRSDPPHPVRNRRARRRHLPPPLRRADRADESTLREHAVLDPAATVTRDVERLRSAPAISPRVSVSGHVYDVVTGLVETVLPATCRDDQDAANCGTEMTVDRQADCREATANEQAHPARTGARRADTATTSNWLSGPGHWGRPSRCRAGSRRRSRSRPRTAGRRSRS